MVRHTMTELDMIGQEIAESTHFHKMPGMRLQSPDGWVRLLEGGCDMWEGWPDMTDAATIGCLAQIAWRTIGDVERPTEFRDETEMSNINILNYVWAWDRFLRAVAAEGMTSLNAARELATIFREAGR